MNDKEIKRHFEDLLVNKCKKNLPTEVLKVTKFLNDLDLDTDYQEALIRAPVKRKEDAIQYVLRKQQYKLFLALFAKVNQRDYISKYNLLVQALKAKTDKDRYLIAVLNGYHCYELPINVDQLPSELKQKLYEESWSSEIIKCLYNKTNSFFIPRGQDKTKMQALIYYNTFASYNGTMQRAQDACLPVRHDATAEAECIEFGLKRGGFTVRRACTEWTFEMMLVDMHENIKAFRDECSVLVVCIMSHGGNAFIYDRDGKKGMINTIMDVFRELPDYVPAVLLNQSCQGSNDPNQEVNIRLRPVDGKQSAGCAKDDTLTDRIQKDVHQSLGYGETDALGIPAASSIDETSQIIVKRPNTAVISATPPSFSAFRQLFLFFMAQQFRQADGETTLESMVNSCSRMMSQQSDVLYRAQAPSLQSVMRNNLILPKALMYDNKVENRGLLRRWVTTGSMFLDAIKDIVSNK